MTATTTSRLARLPPARLPDAAPVPPGSGGGVVFSPFRESARVRHSTRRALTALRQAMACLRTAETWSKSQRATAHGLALRAEMKRLERVLRLQVDRVRGLR